MKPKPLQKQPIIFLVFYQHYQGQNGECSADTYPLSLAGCTSERFLRCHSVTSYETRTAVECPHHEYQPSKRKTVIIRKRGRNRIICLCLHPRQRTSYSSDPRAAMWSLNGMVWDTSGGTQPVPRLGSIEVSCLALLPQHPNRCRTPVPAQNPHSVPFCPAEACRNLLSDKEEQFYPLSPTVSSNWKQDVIKVVKIRRGQVHVKRQKGCSVSLLEP